MNEGACEGAEWGESLRVRGLNAGARCPYPELSAHAQTTPV